MSGQHYETGTCANVMVLVFGARKPRSQGGPVEMLHQPCGLLYKLWGTRHRKTHNPPETSSGGKGSGEGEQRQESDFLPRKWRRKAKQLVEPGSEPSYLDFRFEPPFLQ